MTTTVMHNGETYDIYSGNIYVGSHANILVANQIAKMGLFCSPVQAMRAGLIRAQQNAISAIGRGEGTKLDREVLTYEVAA